MIGVPQNLNESRDTWVVCASWLEYAKTYQVWCLYLHPLWRYEGR